MKFALVLCLLLTTVGGCQQGIPLPEPRTEFQVKPNFVTFESTDSLRWAIQFLTYEPLQDLQAPLQTTITFESCGGDVNAYYFPGSKAISICYPLINYFELLMGPELAVHATMWVLGHEIGHAFFDYHKLPLVREEDVADAFAVWYSSELQSLSAMIWFSSTAEEDISDISPEDPHSSHSVRAYNIQCWLFGKYERPEYLIGLSGRDCVGEWEQIDALFTSAAVSSPLKGPSIPSQ